DQIDLISMMAFSDGRAKKYMFTDNYIISNWGLVYSKPDTKVNSILELNGKRVGVMRNNIHDKAFRKLAKKFALNIEIVPLDNFSDVMKNVQSGKVDAGVANRLFGVLNADKYGLVQTGIIFNPINIHYSTLATNQRVIIDAIDKQLGLYKNKKDSVYFTTLDHWLHQSADTKLPGWLVYLAIALVSIIVLMVGINLLLRRQVASRTRELQLEVDERRQTDRLLDELAYFDSLTKLPNRVSLLDNLRVSIASAKRRNKKVAVLFIDIDRFKTVNDSLGHDAGDQLIIHVAKRLQTCLRGEDTINRFGGDEFVAVLHDIDDLSYIDHITERMLKCLSLPINIGITEIYTSICIGVAVYPDDDDSGEHLLKYADAAMYHAKE
ncbi:MAG: GGDEF domain-containing protein, partial [Gammaproteobacteria bacterium]|nr:GGDEF domain-containing protein [Gammaproteobacteria bacterium]